MEPHDSISKPIIGLTTGGRREKEILSIHYDEYYHIPALYVDAVRRAGGLPVLLPPGETDWQAWLKLVDAVIVTGGADVNPAAYDGDAQHPQLTVIDTERDASEIDLARTLAEANRWPTLCICRGVQVLNVALGGTLYEHIPDVREPDIHRGGDGGWAVQTVHVDSDSLVAEVMGTTEVATYSGHHQAVKTAAPGTRVVATAPDGIIEALEVPGHPWLIAVQWHPEVSAATDPTQQAIFDALVAAARQRTRESRTVSL
ncbi:MAG: gamma-glutamyl-gamma-aminobutyrate hydrolase family protein [Anaerolineae bacterium]|nr:gamma-glutamyl-gamma-aminobutyrate hydrolase family protein [Anaerolineae bacterium]